MKSRKLRESLTALDRRQLLCALSGAAATATLARGARADLLALFGGTAWAAGAGETFFIEVDLRDQWDFGHVFVPPGLATAGGLVRGSVGRQAALYYGADELVDAGGGIYLTGDSAALAPHADSIAVLDLCELTLGPIHGHEAANATRSPGRGYDGGAGRLPMWLNDPATSDGGNVNHYGTTPTPACLHNLAQKQMTAGLANGFVFKGVGRPDHTVYHFAAGVAGAELDRFQTADDFVVAWSGRAGRLLPSKAQTDALVQALKALDRRALLRRGAAEATAAGHDTDLNALGALIFADQTALPDLTLSAAEREAWCGGIPAQVGTSPSTPLGEQFAYISRLFKSGLARTAAAEYGYLDIHGGRTEEQVRTMGKQLALPLARLIAALKADGIYERTLIAVYAADGGRAPAADSYGSEGKNNVILAGGMIRGGYYGDIQVAGPDGDGNLYRYHRPDAATGRPIEAGTIGNDKRVSGAEAWQTVMAALGVPQALRGAFPDAAAAPLGFLLRA